MRVLLIVTLLSTAQNTTQVALSQVTGTRGGTTIDSSKYSSLTTAFLNIPANGSLRISGANTIGGLGITTGQDNITVSCAPGGIIKAGASDIALLAFTGRNQTLQNCPGFDSDGHTRVVFVYADGAENFSSTGNTFTDATGTAIGHAINKLAPAIVSSGSSVITLASNPYANGQQVTYNPIASGTIPDGLVIGQRYYVINSTATTLQLSLAFRGSPVTFSAPAVQKAYLQPASSGPASGVSTGINLANNTYKGVSQAHSVFNSDNIDIHDEHCIGTTNDCSIVSVSAFVFPNGARFRYRNNTSVNGGGVAMIEVFGNGFQRYDLEGNNSTGPRGLISWGTKSTAGPTDQLVDGVISHNTGVNTHALYPAAAGPICIENYGVNVTIDGNVCEGHYQVGIVFGGTGFKIINNSFREIGGASPNGRRISNGSFAIGANGDGDPSKYPTGGNLIQENTSINTQDGMIMIGQTGATGGDIVKNNHDYRSFGAFSTDTSEFYQSIVIVKSSSPDFVEGNDINLIAPSHGFSLSSPGTFAWTCLNNSSSGVGSISFSGNRCTNRNLIGFGALLSRFGGAANYVHSTLSGNISSNLAQIGDAVGGLSSVLTRYENNQSLAGQDLAATVSAGGAGYVVGDLVTIIQTGAANGVLEVKSATGGTVTALALSGGLASGYSAADGLATTGGKGTGLTVNLKTVNNGRPATDFTITQVSR